MSRYFSKSHDPIVMILQAPGEECHLDFSPKSCTYPTLATIDPPEVKIILLGGASPCSSHKLASHKLGNETSESVDRSLRTEKNS